MKVPGWLVVASWVAAGLLFCWALYDAWCDATEADRKERLLESLNSKM